MKSTLHKIGRKFGRRSHDRFSIPGATISWSYIGKENSPDETMPLSDISRFGLSLLTNTPPEICSDVILKIDLPRKLGNLELFGSTVYSIFRGPGLTYEYRVGVALKPFSDAEGDNSLQAEEVIAKLEELYGKHMEEQDIED